MSWRMRSSYLKPPLPKSPIRLRSRQLILSNSSSSTTLQTPPGGGASNLEHLAADSAPVFERGRFYDEYSAKRNERLKRKKGGGGGDDDSVVKGTTPYSLGVEPRTTKRRGTTAKKKTTTTVETTAAPRYSLRSMTKENKKPPPLPINVAVTSAMKKSVTTMRGRRI